MPVQATIPTNYTDAGKILGMFEIRNVIEAGSFGIPAILLILFYSPFGLTVTVICGSVIIIPVCGFALMGIHDYSLLNFLRVWLKWRKSRRILLYREERKVKWQINKKERRSLKSIIFGTHDNPGVSYSNSRQHSTQAFVPVSDIKDGVIITNDGRYVKILEILPVNFHLKSAAEQQNIIYYFASYLKIAPDNLQFLAYTGRANIDAWCGQMEAFYESERNEDCRDMILENAELVNDLAANEAVSRNFYIVFAINGSSEEYEQIAAELEDQAHTARQYAYAY